MPVEKPSMRRLLHGAAIILALCAAGLASGQDYPTRPVKIVVPFAPGGTIDVQARAIGAQLNETLKQPFIVENRPGAGTTIAATYVAKSAPDGYTLLLILRTFAISPSVFAKLQFDPVRDFEPVTLVESHYWIFCSTPGLPARNFKEFLALARSKPNGLNYAVTGVGTDNHLTMERFQKVAGIQLTQVPYSGGGPAVVAMLGGQVDVMLVPGSLALPHIRSGKMRPLAIFADTRAPSVPDVPTMAEEGYEGFGEGGWTGLFAPKGTPESVVRLLNAEVRKIVDRHREKGTLHIEGIQVSRGSTPEELGTLVRSEVAKWRQLAQEVGIKPE